MSLFESKAVRSELVKFGYAPGNYFIMCREGNHQAADCDKRAWCCLECAEKLLAKENKLVCDDPALANRA